MARRAHCDDPLIKKGAMMAPILEVRNATKRFPGVLANDQISFSLNEGEILAFLGENGAGKSTLMNILYGLYEPDEGEIEVRGKEVDIEDPNDAIALGIGMVHQHFQLVPVFTVAENIIMGAEPTRPSFSWRTLATAGGSGALLFLVGGFFALDNVVQWGLAALAGGTAVAGIVALVMLLGWLTKFGFRIYFPIMALGSAALLIAVGLILGSTGQLPFLVFVSLLFAAASFPALKVLNTAIYRRAAAARIRELSDQYGLAVDPDAIVEDIPVGVQQRVEIIKTLYREAEILILDEPTAVLTPQETEELFEIMQSLTEQGKSIMFITHKLKEVMAIADRVIVLRDGRLVGETRPADTSREELAEMMVGREVDLLVDKGPASPGDVVLEVSGLTAEDTRGHRVLRGVDLFVRAGEILGVAGVQGNGQTELVEVLTGLHPATGGTVHILGKDVTNAAPRRITELGVAHIPEDRQQDGLVMTFPIFDNVVLSTYYLEPYAQGPAIQFEEVYEYADRVVKEFDVRTPSIILPAQTLSGGNQQKLIVAREFSRPIKLMIAAQPTRGLDVGSVEYIHSQIVLKRDAGVAVLLVSVELDEIMALSDRIAVMYEGQIVGTVDADKVTREELGLMMAGASLEEEKGEVTVD
ncbi:MAG: ATP-binding cassette domain-containing protein [Anaerolineae bacterium]|nr:ATP-binding cassette domain-containing protein [Anaerolineae bacterium]NIQ81646.1 ATP-binding cassette domain-containing protein [Anaerolineae bacterium]